MSRAEPAPLHVVAHNGGTTWGGGELGTVLLLAGLQERGHRVRMLFRNRELADRAAAHGIPVGVRPLGGPVALHDALALARDLRRLGPDVALLTTFKKVFLGALGARLAGVPRVVQRVVLEGTVPKRLHQRIGVRRWVDAVTLNADAMRPAFLAADPALDPGRVITIHDGVKAPRRSAPRGSVRAALGIPAQARVIGSVGRLAHQKRFDRLVEALALLPPDVHCILAGDGGQRARVEARAAELGVSARLHLLGFRGDVGDVLDALDLYVVSSDSEGMANAMLEAMAFGLPVVSTDVSGAGEALAPLADGGVPGRVVALHARDLAAGITPFLEDERLRRNAADAAGRVAEERFGWRRFVDEWERLLRGDAP